ncbi:efflux RND transporter periplasmic adaptor subunit [Pectinatus haikarae]|uniref:Membrane fusion protein (Multidrug efflux system) n=1 Tax=Pectinatus haikarae TaxID=349096 RepID=A0ABT9Y3E4_9FIRM|nr:efflux RND transporter periplasmic adaptor subunit [Pectinatus haikarae]MDQ0202340.1 membrane fusion protein (multidrug efflux system) [Pectinatus haikarae]
MLLGKIIKNHRILIASILILGLSGVIFFYYSNDNTIHADEKKVKVKIMHPLQQDISLSYKYVGTVKAEDEIKIQSNISGKIKEKYVKGGQYVRQGQALYEIDSRQYESALLSARAALEQSKAILHNAEIDLARDEKLLASSAVSEQKVTTQQSQVRQNNAVVAANEALVKKAQEDLDDTVVYAPISGRLDLKDVPAGTYAAAGSTTLATVGTSDPTNVQFNISENEYLKTISEWNDEGENKTVNLILSNGKEYPLPGSIFAVDRSLTENTGSLTVKALFPNPDNDLLPGMFARVRISGPVIPNAILVPQRAVQQLLDKAFVNIVNNNGEAEAREVKLGDKVGSYYIIEEGIKAEDQIIVEGLVKIEDGTNVEASAVIPEEMGFSLTEDTETNMDS